LSSGASFAEARGASGTPRETRRRRQRRRDAELTLDGETETTTLVDMIEDMSVV
jgi:hypothetical protein